MRDRIAKAIHDFNNPGDWQDHDYGGECSCYAEADAVLGELGWDNAPKVDAYIFDLDMGGNHTIMLANVGRNSSPRFRVIDDQLLPGTYRLIREGDE